MEPPCGTVLIEPGRPRRRGRDGFRPLEGSRGGSDSLLERMHGFWALPRILLWRTAGHRLLGSEIHYVFLAASPPRSPSRRRHGNPAHKVRIHCGCRRSFATPSFPEYPSGHSTVQRRGRQWCLLTFLAKKSHFTRGQNDLMIGVFPLPSRAFSQALDEVEECAPSLRHSLPIRVRRTVQTTGNTSRQLGTRPCAASSPQ